MNNRLAFEEPHAVCGFAVNVLLCEELLRALLGLKSAHNCLENSQTDDFTPKKVQSSCDRLNSPEGALARRVLTIQK